MSARLPSRPNLEHLKNQAKKRLQALRRRRADATLVEAQREIAREYGFASWPRLKAHVESLAPAEDAAPAAAPQSSRGGASSGGGGVTRAAGESPSSGYTFWRYTDKAKQATFFSRYEAGQQGAVHIEPEHLLLGVIRAGHGLESRIVERLHLAADEVREQLAPVAGGRSPQEIVAVQIPFSDATKAVLRLAVDEADRFGHEGIGLVHLLLGLLRERPPLVAPILERQGVRLERVREQVEALRDERTA